MNDTGSFKVFSGTNSQYLAEKICASLGVPLGENEYSALCGRRVFGFL